MINKIQLKEASKKDARFFWDLVNDPAVRQVSFTPEEIPWEIHKEWFEKRIEDCEAFLFVAMNEGNEKIGQLRFEKKIEGYVISVSLVEEFRGKGFGTTLIQTGSQKLFDICPDAEIINAYIKHENIASIHSFEKAGYVKKGFSTINEKDDALLMIKKK